MIISHVVCDHLNVSKKSLHQFFLVIHFFFFLDNFLPIQVLPLDSTFYFFLYFFELPVFFFIFLCTFSNFFFFFFVWVFGFFPNIFFISYFLHRSFFCSQIMLISFVHRNLKNHCIFFDFVKESVFNFFFISIFPYFF